MPANQSVGVIGGNGHLGGAIARAWLKSGTVAPERLWISSRSGNFPGFEPWPDVNYTTDNQALVDACDVVLLSVPPHLAPELGIDARGRLLMSVMAGVTIDYMARHTGAERIMRAMSNPAAENHLAYSPWCAGPGIGDADRATTRALFEACGLTDEVPDERQIDIFTALTGPVPGFVAYFAHCMVEYAVRKGIDPQVAHRAIRQEFKASGEALSETEAPLAETIESMLAYAGTTAAGLEAMRASALLDCVAEGLDAAAERARTIGPSDGSG